MHITLSRTAVVLARVPRGWRVLNAPLVGAFLPDMRQSPLRCQPDGREFLHVEEDLVTLRGWDGRTVVYRLRAPNAFVRTVRLGDKVYDDLDEHAESA